MDWKIIIAEIQEFGHLTQPQIAAVCGCGQGTVSDLVNGKTAQPRHSLGEALLSLRARVKAELIQRPAGNEAATAQAQGARGQGALTNVKPMSA